jgi:hypothetical protein
MPDGLSFDERVRYAASVDGLYAFGWAMEEPVKRRAWKAFTPVPL